MKDFVSLFVWLKRKRAELYLLIKKLLSKKYFFHITWECPVKELEGDWENPGRSQLSLLPSSPCILCTKPCNLLDNSPCSVGLLKKVVQKSQFCNISHIIGLDQLSKSLRVLTSCPGHWGCPVVQPAHQQDFPTL